MKIVEAYSWLQQPWPGTAANGVLNLCDLHEADVLMHFKEQVKPLKRTEERAKELIAQLGSKNDDEDEEAFDDLRVLDLRLAMKPMKALEYTPQGRDSPTVDGGDGNVRWEHGPVPMVQDRFFSRGQEATGRNIQVVSELGTEQRARSSCEMDNVDDFQAVHRPVDRRRFTLVFVGFGRCGQCG